MLQPNEDADLEGNLYVGGTATYGINPSNLTDPQSDKTLRFANFTMSSSLSSTSSRTLVAIFSSYISAVFEVLSTMTMKNCVY